MLYLQYYLLLEYFDENECSEKVLRYRIWLLTFLAVVFKNHKNLSSRY